MEEGAKEAVEEMLEEAGGQQSAQSGKTAAGTETPLCCITSHFTVNSSQQVICSSGGQHTQSRMYSLTPDISLSLILVEKIYIDKMYGSDLFIHLFR